LSPDPALPATLLPRRNPALAASGRVARPLGGAREVALSLESPVAPLVPVAGGSSSRSRHTGEVRIRQREAVAAGFRDVTQCFRRQLVRSFLTARWESLVLLNYRCPPELLQPFVPRGTELDSWRGTNLSLVGFRFVDTRVAGVPVPGHRTFEEVNLRFYVKRHEADGIRRGVVFLRELVPKRLVAFVGRVAYNEPYLALPMAHDVRLDPKNGGEATYSWKHGGLWHSLTARVQGPASRLAPGSEAEFITEHYWGYNRQRSGRTLEYRVDHPPWLVWESNDATYTSPEGSALYGPDFSGVLTSGPSSAFVAVGSGVEVFGGVRLRTG